MICTHLLHFAAYFVSCWSVFVGGLYDTGQRLCLHWIGGKAVNAGECWAGVWGCLGWCMSESEWEWVWGVVVIGIYAMPMCFLC